MITGKLTKNFTLNEMKNNNAIEKVKLIITPEVVTFAQMIQELRDYYGKPIKVNSWYRTPAYNKKCGGSSNSIHLDGRACDLAVTDYENLTRVWQSICKKYNKIGGVNYYNTFMHFDNYEDKFGNKRFIIRDYRKEK